jgi:hypothetical protein
MQPVDYKSHELNLYSNNNVGRLRFVDGKGTGLGPGFGQNQEYIFAKYTDDAKGQYQWPVCIPELHTIDNSTGYVIGVGWAIYDGKEKLNDEAKARADADSKLSDRIDFIVSNTNPAAIDSLSEIVSQFSQNGQGYASRLTYLESIVASLVNKSQ